MNRCWVLGVRRWAKTNLLPRHPTPGTRHLSSIQMKNKRATKLRRAATALLAVGLMMSWLARSAAAQDNQTLTPEQSKAVSEALELMTQSSAAEEGGKLEAAAELRERAQAIIEKGFGPDHLLSALNLPLLAFVYAKKGDHARAESLYLRAIGVKEKLHGAEHPEVSNTLLVLAGLYNSTEQFAKAEAAASRALAIREKALGPERPEVAEALFYLATTYSRKGDYARAEPLLQRTLAIQEKALGPEHMHVALVVNNLAHLYSEKGDYEQAERFFLRALSLFEKVFGPEHPMVATPLNSLASLYRQKGDYLRAEPLFKRGLAIAEKALGPDAEDVAIALNSLALLYSDKGDDERALPLFRRALAIREKVLGPNNSSVAATLVSIAAIHNERREYAQAVALYERALKIAEQALGTENPLYASILSNLAVTYAEQGDAARAEPLARKALEIRERVLGPEHPDVATTLNTLAYLYFIKHEFEREEPLYLRALRIAEKALGPDHPTVGTLLANLSTIYWGRGDAARALPLLTRIAELRERNLALILTTGSEEQKRRYMATLANETDANVSFHMRAAPQDRQAARLALTTILRRKGRVLDAVTDQIGALRRRLNPEDRALLDRLSTARSALARLALSEGEPEAAGRRVERDRLRAEVERLEEEVSARSAEFRVVGQPVTLSRVQEAIPSTAALIELVAYRPYDPKAAASQTRFGARRYVAYVLRREGEPVWAELGEAEPIDRAVEAWRRSLVSPAGREVKERARSLDGLVMLPLRKLLGETRQLFLSPDGALNLIPFGALVDEQGRYLVENYSITYLTSGRDLLRTQTDAPARQGPIVVANPSFDASVPGSPAAGEPPSRPSNLRGVSFSPLPGTKGEASALGLILPGVRVLTATQASEATLKQVGGPSILHVATHGFFLPDQPPALSDAAHSPETRGIAISIGSAERAPAENPLLRSGLALAGANQGRGGAGEDGVLTAYEAAALDLWGTRLVVLSACETGVGDVRVGDGVYGLRRALVLAGSESQVMSLWQVDDAATRDLMVAYYKRLRAGEGRTEALRAVQLGMLRGGGAGGDGPDRALSPRAGARGASRSHPFFWASFIQSGDWRGLAR
jgi:CHAT domain-containing protein/Tfp pilus assembly protein PilF